jgi:hypothetical protein
VIVGQFYQVPAVRVATWHGFVGWLPVIGPMHEDAEFVGFPEQHFHVDWQFAPREVWRNLGNRWYPGNHFAWPIQCPDNLGVRVILEGPVLKRMKCKRDPGCFPVEKAKNSWLPRLQQSLACAKLVNGVCPHRGIPVSAMHREGDILTCPGHGLQWNAVTGLLHTS